MQANPVVTYLVATAPTVYGIETAFKTRCHFNNSVATAPTVYGIETMLNVP